MVSVTALFPLLPAASDFRFGTADSPDSTFNFKASFGTDKRLPSLLIIPVGFAGGLRAFFNVMRLDETDFSPGRDRVGTVIPVEFASDFSELPADTLVTLTFVRAFPSKMPASGRRRGVDARALLTLLLAVVAACNLGV